MTKSLRAGKIFLDWSQNNGAKTTIAPYSMRGVNNPPSRRRAPGRNSTTHRCVSLRYDEVLDRVARDGDLLAALDEDDRCRID